jgi:hypothetical protein
MAKKDDKPEQSESKADIDRALDIIRSLPMLRRYGDDVEAVKEACAILEAVKEKL